ncbi:MAG: hypothetical protein SCALA702_22760 [Melioribacteraceae bacterium]|nr:MAG: hypothetical protein SCALA702_22760 [Melioribacteraceae bacterium]
MSTLTKTKTGKTITALVVLVIFTWGFVEFLYAPFFEWYTGVDNAVLTYDTSVKLNEKEFHETVNSILYQEKMERAKELTDGIEDEFVRNQKIQMILNTPSFKKETEFKHIKYFEKAGIRQYKGPETCLQCHETMKVKQADGTYKEVETLEDVVNTVHYQFHSTLGGFTTYGYDGRQVNTDGRPIPVGKIDRACGIPGSFSWTGWAALVETKPEHAHGEIVMRSEGCGQCHIGGNYHPATEKMMPIGDVADAAKDGIDCLICHSQQYDLNYKYVIEDEVGTRWNQDRTLKAAMTVTNPANNNCLNCHQHNMGGDVYEHNIAAKSLGYKNQRILHTGAKRANPFSPQNDVHAAAGVLCTDCHQPEGHKIPRGTKGTDLVANDLPGKSVECENCHTSAPHNESDLEKVMLNGHIDKIACETCHIKDLQDYNVVLRDWTNPVWNEEEGLYEFTDILRSGDPGVGFTFLWFNGNGTFLANALGNNPNGSEDYNPLMEQIAGIDDEETIAKIRQNIKSLLADHDIDIDEYMEGFINTLSQMSPEMRERRIEMLDKNIKPLQNQGKSKLYPFKLFNARMYEDMTNEGPFGAMILPFDYPTYYETGKPLDAVKKAIQHPIVKRMYETPFKMYMMDEFMKYFGVGEWKTEYPIDDDGNLRNVEAKWMRQYGTLMVNHGITKKGRQCIDCHSEEGILNYEKLGYDEERAEMLRNLPEADYFLKNYK